jgi:hypothetical protein
LTKAAAAVPNDSDARDAESARWLRWLHWLRGCVGCRLVVLVAQTENI